MERYLYLMPPTLETTERSPSHIPYQREITLTEKYDIVQDMMQRYPKYREELTGSSVSYRYPDLFMEIDVAKAFNIPYHEFLAQSLDIQARLIAHHHLTNMLSIVDRHDDIQKQRLEKAINKDGKK